MNNIWRQKCPNGSDLNYDMVPQDSEMKLNEMKWNEMQHAACWFFLIFLDFFLIFFISSQYFFYFSWLLSSPESCGAAQDIVNCPTRWSLSFVFVFLCWSSSWRLGPHIEGGRLLWPLLKAGMTVLTQFFCKMYFL